MMERKISNRDIILLYIYDLAKVDIDKEPWHERHLPKDAEIRQVEAREILRKYERTSNPGSVYKILSSRYFRRLGDNPRSPYVPTSEGWNVVKYYLNVNVNGKTVKQIWMENNVEDDSIKEYRDRYLLLNIVMDYLGKEEERKNGTVALEDKEEEEQETEGDNEDFVEYMLLGSKLMELGLERDAYMMFEKALERNELLLSIPYNMSLILGKEGFYREALKIREEYWKRFDKSLLRERMALEKYLNEGVKEIAEKASYAVLEGDISSCVKYFEDLAEELDNDNFSSLKRMSNLARTYAMELKKYL